MERERARKMKKIRQGNVDEKKDEIYIRGRGKYELEARGHKKKRKNP